MSPLPHRSNRAEGRLGRIGDAMTRVIDSHMEAQGREISAVVILRDGNEGAMVMHGWGEDGDAAALSSAVASIEAACATNGLTFTWNIE